jgi:hypothetical protein
VKQQSPKHLQRFGLDVDRNAVDAKLAPAFIELAVGEPPCVASCVLGVSGRTGGRHERGLL